MTSPVSYEIVDEIGVITVDNPPVNALSQAVRKGLLDAIRAAQADASAAVLIHCDGRTFIAGADITEFGKPQVEPFLPDLLDEIEASGKLVIAALHWSARGQVRAAPRGRRHTACAQTGRYRVGSRFDPERLAD